MTNFWDEWRIFMTFILTDFFDEFSWWFLEWIFVRIFVTNEFFYFGYTLDHLSIASFGIGVPTILFYQDINLNFLNFFYLLLVNCYWLFYQKNVILKKIMKIPDFSFQNWLLDPMNTCNFVIVWLEVANLVFWGTNFRFVSKYFDEIWRFWP